MKISSCDELEYLLQWSSAVELCPRPSNTGTKGPLRSTETSETTGTIETTGTTGTTGTTETIRPTMVCFTVLYIVGER